jgi:predicted RNase H-like nuclease
MAQGRRVGFVHEPSMSDRRNLLHRFVGVDPAWAIDQRHSGVAVLEGGERGAELVALSSQIHSLDGITQLIRQHLAPNLVVAIDASLIVSNHTGQRPCERSIGQAFGCFGASCHSTNRSRRHFDSGERLVSRLAREGFRHGLPLSLATRRPGRWLIEVYPHPAMVRLFNLGRILPYKKGPIPERRAGLTQLQAYIGELMTSGRGLKASPCLEQLLEARPQDRRGRALKMLEDLLDAVFCAYLAWYFWRWGEERNDVFGDLESGYVVVPRRDSLGCQRCPR